MPFCPKCGEEVGQGNKICGNCWTSFDTDDSKLLEQTVSNQENQIDQEDEHLVNQRAPTFTELSGKLSQKEIGRIQKIKPKSKRGTAGLLTGYNLPPNAPLRFKILITIIWFIWVFSSLIGIVFIFFRPYYALPVLIFSFLEFYVVINIPDLDPNARNLQRILNVLLVLISIYGLFLDSFFGTIGIVLTIYLVYALELDQSTIILFSSEEEFQL